MNPIELLQAELKTLERSKEKSIEAFKGFRISDYEHFMHLQNLNPKIKRYKEAINKLK